MVKKRVKGAGEEPRVALALQAVGARKLPRRPKWRFVTASRERITLSRRLDPILEQLAGLSNELDSRPAELAPRRGAMARLAWAVAVD
jgi:hypothetical protein